VEEMTNENLSSDSQDSSSTQKKKGGWKSVKYILGKQNLQLQIFFILFFDIIITNVFYRIYVSKFMWFFIIGNETLEKLASMSLIANLIVYMHTQYNMDTTFSVEVFNIWSGFTNFLPLIAAYMADAYIGKFKMVIFGSIASFLVNIYILTEYFNSIFMCFLPFHDMLLQCEISKTSINEYLQFQFLNFILL
jgi:hypothetical protein